MLLQKYNSNNNRNDGGINDDNDYVLGWIMLSLWIVLTNHKNAVHKNVYKINRQPPFYRLFIADEINCTHPVAII